MMRRISSKIWAGLLLSLLIFGLAGCSSGSKAVAVSTASARLAEMEMPLEFSGALLPVQTVEISSRVAAQVEHLGFTVGTPVKMGDVLVRLDSQAIEGQLVAAQASLASAQAAVENAVNQAEMAKIAYDAAQRSYDRNQQLFASGAISQNQLDESKDSMDTARNRWQSADGPARKQALAAVDSARASVDNLRIQLQNTEIKSPIDGVLASQNIDVGEVLAVGVNVITVVDTSALELKSTISQDKLSLLGRGQELAVKVDGYPDREWAGVVTVVGPVAVNTGEIFPVVIRIKNDGQLMAGLAAHASTRVKVSGVIVPSAAVMQSGGGSFVFVVKDGLVLRTPVVGGLSNGAETVIVSGLTGDETIAVTNLGALSDHTAVTIL